MRRVEDVIPANILAAARKAGLHSPDWYVGRTRRDVVRKKTFEDLVRDVQGSEAGSPSGKETP